MFLLLIKEKIFVKVDNLIFLINIFEISYKTIK